MQKSTLLHSELMRHCQISSERTRCQVQGAPHQVGRLPWYVLSHLVLRPRMLWCTEAYGSRLLGAGFGSGGLAFLAVGGWASP